MCQSHDNLPGVSWQSSVDTSQIKSEHAVSAMIRLVNGNPGLYHLLCVHSTEKVNLDWVFQHLNWVMSSPHVKGQKVVIFISCLVWSKRNSTNILCSVV